jgi:hypothetical protein
MAWTRKWVNNSGSEVSVATVTAAAALIKDNGAVYGYAGSVVMPAYTGIYSDGDNTEMDAAAAAWTIDKYLNGRKVTYYGQAGYAGSNNRGYTGSVGATGYTGSAA